MTHHTTLDQQTLPEEKGGMDRLNSLLQKLPAGQRRVAKALIAGDDARTYRQVAALSNGLKSTAGGGTVLKPGVVVTGNNPRGQLVIEELVEGAVTKEIARVADGNAWLDGDAGDAVVTAFPYNLSRLPTS